MLRFLLCAPVLKESLAAGRFSSHRIRGHRMLFSWSFPVRPGLARPQWRWRAVCRGAKPEPRNPGTPGCRAFAELP
jgi:hypothetical protein